MCGGGIEPTEVQVAQNLCVLYIDDYLLCTRKQEQAVRDTAILTIYLTELGLRINPIKSCLVPHTEQNIRINNIYFWATQSEVSHVIPPMPLRVQSGAYGHTKA